MHSPRGRRRRSPGGRWARPRFPCGTGGASVPEARGGSDLLCTGLEGVGSGSAAARWRRPGSARLAVPLLVLWLASPISLWLCLRFRSIPFWRIACSHRFVSSSSSVFCFPCADVFVSPGRCVLVCAGLSVCGAFVARASYSSRFVSPLDPPRPHGSLVSPPPCGPPRPVQRSAPPCSPSRPRPGDPDGSGKRRGRGGPRARLRLCCRKADRVACARCVLQVVWISACSSSFVVHFCAL